MTLIHADATSLAQAVQAQKTTATGIIRDVLAQVAALDPALNCFTAVLSESAMAQAEAVDQAIANGLNPSPLAGVPFAVKNLFDLEGVTTLAGSIINTERPPATRRSPGCGYSRHGGLAPPAGLGGWAPDAADGR